MDEESAIERAKQLARPDNTMVVWFNKLTNFYHVLPLCVYGKIDSEVVYVI